MPTFLAALTSRSQHIFGNQPLLFRAAVRTLASKPEKALTTYFSTLRREASPCFRNQRHSIFLDRDNAFTRQYTQLTEPKAPTNPSSSTALLSQTASFMGNQPEQIPLKPQDRPEATYNPSNTVYSL